MAGFVLMGLLAGCAAFSGGGGGNASSEQHLQKAQQAIDRGDFQTAYEQLNQALTINPKDPEIHRNLGWLYIYSGKPDEAKRQLDALHEIAPEAPGTYHLRGGLLSHLNQQQDAVENFEKALDATEEGGQLPEESETQEALKSRLYFDMATSLSALQEHDDALKTLKEGFRYVSKEDRADQTNFQMAICSEHYSLKEFDNAYEACEKAMVLTEDEEEKERINDFIQNMKLAEELETLPPADAEEPAAEEESN